MNTVYYRNLVANNLFGTKGASDPGIPEKYYIGLSTSAPTPGTAAGGVPQGCSEPPVAAGYARKELTSLVKGEQTGVVTNDAAVDFDESTQSWGTVTHFAIFDSEAVGSGNLLMYGPLSTARSVEAATIMTIRKNFLNLSVVDQ